MSLKARGGSPAPTHCGCALSDSSARRLTQRCWWPASCRGAAAVRPPRMRATLKSQSPARFAARTSVHAMWRQSRGSSCGGGRVGWRWRGASPPCAPCPVTPHLHAAVIVRVHELVCERARPFRLRRRRVTQRGVQDDDAARRVKGTYEAGATEYILASRRCRWHRTSPGFDLPKQGLHAGCCRRWTRC